mmetsp:Transcript_23440/g.56955  ORF Transcript_23440/g.56955 Transcript_23440/m.56955 type:complete len:105 (+) Transcript_23440:2610-2924(+)
MLQVAFTGLRCSADRARSIQVVIFEIFDCGRLLSCGNHCFRVALGLVLLEASSVTSACSRFCTRRAGLSALGAGWCVDSGLVAKSSARYRAVWCGMVSVASGEW